MRTPLPLSALWGKLAPRNDPVRWHPLADHSADVAACLEALLDSAIIRSRLASLAGQPTFPEVWSRRLAALAFLHDFGKANRSFQGRKGGGHLKEAAYIAVSAAKRKDAGLDALGGFGAPADFLLAVVLGHHGEPPDLDACVYYDVAWAGDGGRDPLAEVRQLVAQARAIWPDAFMAGGPPLPDPTSRFWHACLGLVQLADWLGSDDSPDAFPFSEEGDGPRIDVARNRARALLDRIGFDGRSLRANHTAPFAFERLFSFAPSDIQRAAAEAPGPVVVLEAETGSGKTEAALWRFAALFAAGKIDGLYFALPTRVAATQMHARVQACVDRMFPAAGIEVVRALPGDVSAGSASVRALPDFQVQWSDDPNEARRRARWAAERPKRFLAAPIAVGTIDQALLGAVKTRHAQMRSACLARSLLVVDEVHASDVFMERLLVNLLDQHRAAGGEALLLSATLGAAARTRLLLGGERAAKKATPAPDPAKEVPYPALSWVEAGRVVSHKKDGRGRGKVVAVEPSPAIAEPDAVAALALDAAGRGAKVLVVRNTVRDAVATVRALQALAPDHPALFRLDGIATLHHGRFARSDRVRLDGAVEAAIGKKRPDGPLIVAGTQTLEQSLDIDADFLIADLAPIDVLLQRIGRLHRHDRTRPAGFAAPRATVLVPQGFEATLTALASGCSGPHGFGFVYDNLIALAASARLIGTGATWDIPAMNRDLVEAGTHPDTLAALVARLAEETGDERWRAVETGKLGKDFAKRQTAQGLVIGWNEPVLGFRPDERPMTRLGLGDVEVEFPGGVASPFPGSPPIERLVVPAHLLGGAGGEAQPVDIVTTPGGFSFRLNERVFSYGQHGLERQ